MKKILCMFACLVVMLSGCGHETESIDSEQISTYDSKIVYLCAGVDNTELDEISKILKDRFRDIFSAEDYSINVDYNTHEIYLNLNYKEEWTDFFVEVSALSNSVEFRKGYSYTDELIINNDNILKAESIYDEVMCSWSVMIEFDEKGTDLFAKTTKEIAGTDTPISIWLNKELIYAPLVSEAISDGRTIITGDFTEQSANKLAKQICLEYLPYSISIKEANLAVKNNES